MILRMPWRPGACTTHEGPVFVSATKFAYRRFGPLPANAWHALRFWYDWGRVEGAIGLSMGADWLSRTTYSVSAWRSAADLQRWLRSPGHAVVSREFRPHLRYSVVDGWTVERFVLRHGWAEAMERFAKAEAARALR